VTAVLNVQEPGLFTTVQDLGRPNAISAGVQSGGAMDRFAHAAANLLVGNDVGHATLECTFSGPHLVAEHPCLVAVAGADFDPHVNGTPVPGWTSMLLGAGDQLTFGPNRKGARMYIALAGGIEADRWLGSLSTNVMAARGGKQGRPLERGDNIAAAGAPRKPSISRLHLAESLRPVYGDHILHSIPGPHVKRLNPESRSNLFGMAYRVTKDANRMGYRLEGPRLDTSGEELLSFGLVPGALQVPHGGQPILLMADHQTAGGYPVVATVVSASMPVAAQLLPGDEVLFAEATAERAQQMRMALGAALETLR
jgi:antagonist of KipI